MTRTKITLMTVATTIAALLWWWAGEVITLPRLQEEGLRLRQVAGVHPFAAAAAFVAAYATTALFLPGALVLTLVAGYLFGPLIGGVLVVAGGTSGAAVSFLLARSFLAPQVERRYLRQLEELRRHLAESGWSYLLTVRILPVFPFFLVNLLAGAARIPFALFTLTTACGMAPGAFMYAWAGQRLQQIRTLDEVMTPQTLLPLFGLAAFVLLPPLVIRLRRKKR